MSDMNDDRKKLKQRNLAVAIALLFMVAMFFTISLVKVQEGMNVPG